MKQPLKTTEEDLEWKRAKLHTDLGKKEKSSAQVVVFVESGWHFQIKIGETEAPKALNPTSLWRWQQFIYTVAATYISPRTGTQPRAVSKWLNLAVRTLVDLVFVCQMTSQVLFWIVPSPVQRAWFTEIQKSQAPLQLAQANEVNVLLLCELWG